MKIFLYVVSAFALFVVALFTFKSVNAQGETSGVAKGLDSDGNVYLCGEKPNCVSTIETREDFLFLPPSVTAKATIKAIVDLLRAEHGPEVLILEPNYAHLVYRTAIFRFPDDIELTIKDGKLMFRSQSREGYSDLGKNRSRMKEILEVLKKNELIEM